MASEIDTSTTATYLLTVNTTTGTMTDLGASVNTLDAIAFDIPPSVVPALSPSVLAALADIVLVLGGLTLCRRV
jgi:hypothetical protein